jgi:hypothetical protein
MKPLRFSAHVQLQYLIKKLRINQAELVKEMEEHYQGANLPLKTTKKNKVTAVGVGESQPRKPKKRAVKPVKRTVAKPQPNQPKTVVVYKKRRFTVKPE